MSVMQIPIAAFSDLEWAVVVQKNESRYASQSSQITTRVDQALFTRFSESLFPAYHQVTRIGGMVRLTATPLLWLWWTAMRRIVRRFSGMPDEMVPEEPLTTGIENNGIGGEFYEILRNGLVRTKRAGINSFSGADRVRLDTGEQIDADVGIFATGWRQNVSFLDPELRREIQQDGWFQLYRHILPPGERHLGFVGYASSGNAPLTSEIAAHWLSQCFRGELSLPDTSDMEREIARPCQKTL